MTQQFIDDHQRRHGLVGTSAPNPANAAPQMPAERAGSEKQPVLAEAGEDADFKQPPDAFIGAERILQRDFQTDMERRGVHVVIARVDKRSTLESGLPDAHCMFTATDGITRGCACEFKVAGGRVKDGQKEKIRQMRAAKIPVLVCWSLAPAIEFARKHLLC